MRKSVVFSGCLAALLVGLTVVLWDDLVEGYKQAVALADEAALESGKDMGRLSYHSVRCGRPEVMSEMQQVMDRIDQSAQTRASMRDAFYRGVEEAQAADREYTDRFCADVADQLGRAQD